LNNFKGLQGYDQLPEKGTLLIVTKSLKDVMLFYEFGIPAIAPASESVILSVEQHKELSQRFTKIVTLYDFDLTGVRSANKMRKEFNLPALFLTNGRFGTVDYTAKDPTDLVKKKGKK